MLRKILTILSLIGLLVSVAAWVASYAAAYSLRPLRQVEDG